MPRKPAREHDAVYLKVMLGVEVMPTAEAEEALGVASGYLSSKEAARPGFYRRTDAPTGGLNWYRRDWIEEWKPWASGKSLFPPPVPQGRQEWPVERFELSDMRRLILWKFDELVRIEGLERGEAKAEFEVDIRKAYRLEQDDPDADIRALAEKAGMPGAVNDPDFRRGARSVLGELIGALKDRAYGRA